MQGAEASRKGGLRPTRTGIKPLISPENSGLCGGRRLPDCSGGGTVEACVTEQQRRDISRGDGLAEQIALPLRAPVGLEISQLLRLFDAFGCGGQAKSLCKAE